MPRLHSNHPWIVARRRALRLLGYAVTVDDQVDELEQPPPAPGPVRRLTPAEIREYERQLLERDRSNR